MAATLLTAEPVWRAEESKRNGLRDFGYLTVLFTQARRELIEQKLQLKLHLQHGHNSFFEQLGDVLHGHRSSEARVQLVDIQINAIDELQPLLTAYEKTCPAVGKVADEQTQQQLQLLEQAIWHLVEQLDGKLAREVRAVFSVVCYLPDSKLETMCYANIL